MARPLRLQYEGAVYHVTARGNEKRQIFFTPTDYKKFREYLYNSKRKHGIIIHSYVLMGNHYHLIVETPKGNLSKAMHYINSSYTTYLNVRHKRTGHLFQGRYKAILVDRDSYLLELSRYIHLNPVKAGIVEKPEDYEFSSYRAFESGKEDETLDQYILLNMITNRMGEARKRYCDYVNGGIEKDTKNPFEGVYGGFILGGEKFIKRTLEQLGEGNLQNEDISHRNKLKFLCSIEEIVQKVAEFFNISIEELKINTMPRARKIAIYLVKKNTAATNQEVGDYFKGLNYSGVGKVNQRFIKEMEGDKEIMDQISTIESNLSNVKG